MPPAPLESAPLPACLPPVGPARGGRRPGAPCVLRQLDVCSAAAMTECFVRAIERYAERHRIDIVTFRRGERKGQVHAEAPRLLTSADFVAMPPLFEDCALKSALFTLFTRKYKSECSVELHPDSGGLLSKPGLPASNRGIVLDRPNLRRKLNVFLCVCCAILPILSYFVSSPHRIIERRFSISGGVGKQPHHLIRVAIDPGPAIRIQPILNVLFRHCLFYRPS